jgi:lysophospholipase L1-like esterase
VSLNCRRLLDADGASSAAARDLYGTVSLAGYTITDDLNFGAEKTILAIGDSILNGTGPTKSNNLWTFKLRDYFKTQGKTVRIVQKANSGMTSSEVETARKDGHYDGVEADLIIYAVGANDASGGVARETYRTNLEAMWTHVQRRWPNAKMIVCGVSPVENNTTHAAAETLRTEAADFVADQDSDRLFYINLGAAFTRTDASYYASSDSAGSRVHPDDDGHAAIATLVNAAIDAQGVVI